MEQQIADQEKLWRKINDLQSQISRLRDNIEALNRENSDHDSLIRSLNNGLENVERQLSGLRGGW